MGDFAKQFREVLEARDLTQMEAAELIGISQSMVSAYAAGKRPPPERTLLLIENRLRMKFDRPIQAKPKVIEADPKKSLIEAAFDAEMVKALNELKKRYKQQAGLNRDQIKHLVAALWGDQAQVIIEWLDGGK